MAGIDLTVFSDDELRWLVRLLGTPAESLSVGDLVGSCPRIVTERWQEDYGGPAGPITALRAYLQEIKARKRGWPWGQGPIEQIFAGLDRAFGLHAAETLAESPVIGASLSLEYASAACEAVTSFLQSGDVRHAVRMHRVLLAAVQADGIEESPRVRSAVWLTWLDVARAAFAESADLAIYEKTLDVERRLTSLSRQADDRSIASDCQFRFAVFIAAPFLETSPERFSSRYLRWVTGRPAVVSSTSGPQTIPSPAEALRSAENGLRQVAADGTAWTAANVGRVHLMLARILIAYTAVDGSDEQLTSLDGRLQEAAGFVLAALDEIPSADLPLRMEAMTLAAALGHEVNPAEADQISSVPVDDLLSAYGLHETARLVLGVAQILMEVSAERALSFLASARHFERQLPEETRTAMLNVHVEALIGGAIMKRAADIIAALPYVPDAGRAFQYLRQETSARPLTESARIALAAAAMAAASEKVTRDHVLPLVGLAESLAPSFTDQHSDAFAFFAASLATKMASSSYQIVVGTGPDNLDETEINGDPVAAAGFLAAALGIFCDLSLAGACLETIDNFNRMIIYDGMRTAPLVVAALQEHMVALEALGGERTSLALAGVMNNCLHRLVDGGAGTSTWLEALHLAKGHAFSSALSAGSSFAIRSDPEGARLLQQVDEGHGFEAAGGGDPQGEVRLVMPYSGAQDEGAASGPIQVLRALQHSFDEYVERRIISGILPKRVSAGQGGSLRADGLIQALPAETALLVLYLLEGEPQRMICTVVTKEETKVVPQPIGARLGLDPTLPELDVLQICTLLFRTAISLLDPGPWVINRELADILEHQLPRALGPTLGILEELRNHGYRNLVVVPHGPLHVFPFHLIGPIGQPLCADWLVTFMPSPFAIAGISSRSRKPRSSQAAALGLDFIGYPGEADLAGAAGRAPALFAELPDAVSEARSVAQAASGYALVNRQATKSALVKALEQSRWVHLATHGVANVHAPIFDSLIVWPDRDDGRFAAYELLDLDLSGLQLVTLSACETALGRFDVADNVRGLTATLLRAGAQCVISALWQVDSETSALFFTVLYGELGRGSPTGEAFRQAQAATRAAYPAYRDWGAFILTGEW